jgi:hypothetical protein
VAKYVQRIPIHVDADRFAPTYQVIPQGIILTDGIYTVVETGDILEPGDWLVTYTIGRRRKREVWKHDLFVKEFVAADDRELWQYGAIIPSEV